MKILTPLIMGKAKRQGAALISMVILSIIIMGLMLMLLYVFYFYKEASLYTEINNRLQTDLTSAENMVLFRKFPFADSIEIRQGLLFSAEMQPDSFQIRDGYWGCFRLAQIDVSYKNRHLHKNFLYGLSSHPFADGVLYLQDNDLPLTIAGNTTLKGKLYLPRAGLRSGFMGQQGFSGDFMPEGPFAISRKELPSINASFLAYLKIIMHSISSDGLSEPGTLPDSVSFDSSKRCVFHHGTLDLDGKKIVGQVIIYSDSSICVTSHSQLNNVILIAPFIKIGDDFHGRFQAFASESISCGQNCRFFFPSALCVLSDSGRSSPKIDIGKSCLLQGELLGIDASRDHSLPRIICQTQTKLYGLLFINGFLSLQGIVYGTVFARTLLEKKDNILMENLLFNAEIHQDQWPSLGALYTPIDSSYNKQIIQWLP